MRLLCKQPQSREWKPKNPYTLFALYFIRVNQDTTRKNGRKGLCSILHFFIRLFRWDVSHANILALPSLARSRVCLTCVHSMHLRLLGNWEPPMNSRAGLLCLNSLSAQSWGAHWGLGASSWPSCACDAVKGVGWLILQHIRKNRVVHPSRLGFLDVYRRQVQSVLASKVFFRVDSGRGI